MALDDQLKAKEENDIPARSTGDCSLHAWVIHPIYLSVHLYKCKCASNVINSRSLSFVCLRLFLLS